jgi:SAM-dependent methyltransferase
VLDVAELPPEPQFDLITAFDAIHDQVDPATVLRRIHEALAPDGTFLMIDIRAASDLADNLDNPMAPFLYSISVLHCMTVSLAGGGAGLGTVWGEQLARSMLEDAGFTRVEVSEAPGPMNNIYVCRK